jgi:hypothetical protein
MPLGINQVLPPVLLKPDFPQMYHGIGRGCIEHRQTALEFKINICEVICQTTSAVLVVLVYVAGLIEFQPIHITFTQTQTQLTEKIEAVVQVRVLIGHLATTRVGHGHYVSVQPG